MTDAEVDIIQRNPGDDHDAEVIEVAPTIVGRPVDPPDEHPNVFVTVTSRTDSRLPIVPAWMRNAEQRAQFARWAIGYIWYWGRAHAWRSPKYATKAAVWSPVGVLRLAGRQIAWWWDRSGFQVEQTAVTNNDPMTFFKARKEVNRRRTFRGGVLCGELVALLAAYVYLYYFAGPLVQLAVVAVAVPVLARIGRPADRPIIDRVINGPRFVKLTAQMVRDAVMSMRLDGLKEPEQITFPSEIHRDGPGYLAVADLPLGLDAVVVVENKRKLASGLRLPADQVWPETMPKAHPGRLAVWVGDQPASEMRQPPWPLLKPNARVDVFDRFELCTNPRLQPIKVGLLFRNWLIGGQPGSGKTVSARDIALACSLDPRVELRLFELKGTGDLDPLEPLCTAFASGADDETAEAAHGAVLWARAECERRGKLIKHYAKVGQAPENKVTPELADAGVGLHPVLLVIDEAQELFTHSKFGSQAGEILEKVIKLGRALGIIIVISTQIPDKKSLPPNITRCVNSRLCHSVADWYANDAILGTGMYKAGHRSTMFQPVEDAGWGILAGFGPTGPVRSYNPSDKDIARIIERALILRGGPVERVNDGRVQAFNLLEDVRRVMLPDEDAVWSELIVPRLAELRPDIYGEMDVNAFGAAMRAGGCPTSSIHRKVDGKGVTRYGVKSGALDTALERRAIR